VAALQFEGRDTYGEHWRSCLAGCALSAFEIAELRIEVEGNLGVCTFLNRCGGIDESGKEKVCWTRATQVYRNLEGRWLIIHEHFSVPFDMKTGEVLFGLTPESSR
jgi:ketosteroid isomerase-like protein